jgi:hypothetical protein
MKVSDAITLMLTMLEGIDRLRKAISKARSEGRDTLTKEEVDGFAADAATANQRLLENINSLS